MFPINFNFPYRKKDGSIITMEKALDGAGADLDLVDLDDVAIENPADGELFEYNGTTGKWKNSSTIPDKLDDEIEARAKLGAHNLCPNKAVAQTNNEVTFTIDSDKVITATISSTTQGNRYLTWHTYTPMKKGRYKLSGCGDGTKGVIYCTKSDNSAHWAENRGGVTEFDITEDITDLFMQVRIDQGVPAGTVKFSVMITDVDDPDTTYAPYAMTNRELTEVIDVTGEFTALSDATINTTTSLIQKNGKHIHGVLRFTTPSTVSANGQAIQLSSLVTPDHTNDYPVGVAFKAWKPTGECMVYVSSGKMLLAGSAWTASEDVMLFIDYFTK